MQRSKLTEDKTVYVYVSAAPIGFMHHMMHCWRFESIRARLLSDLHRDAPCLLSPHQTR